MGKIITAGVSAIQDQLSGNHCFGCGPDNPAGMQIKSYWEDDECVCRYMPEPEQCAGPLHFVYGGTIASLIDCHSMSTAMSNFYRREGRDTGSAPEVWCVTGRLSVDYLAPTPIDKEIELRATIEDCTDKKAVVKCRVYSDGIATAEGDVIAVRVPDSWKNG